MCHVPCSMFHSSPITQVTSPPYPLALLPCLVTLHYSYLNQLWAIARAPTQTQTQTQVQIPEAPATTTSMNQLEVEIEVKIEVKMDVEVEVDGNLGKIESEGESIQTSSINSNSERSSWTCATCTWYMELVLVTLRTTNTLRSRSTHYN